MTARKVQRDLYLSSRAVGDYEAWRRGGLPALGRRLGKRVYHRDLIRVLRKGGIW